MYRVSIMGEAMADQDLTHTADIIKAAIPFVDSPLKGTAELFAKFLDLMGSLKSVTSSGKLAASGLSLSNIDFEGLLKGIRPICTNKEQEMVDKFLGFFNMKRAFEMYNNMMSMMKNMQDVGDFSFADAFGGNDTDNVTGNFNGSAFESIFKTFNGFSDNNSTDNNSADNNSTENKSSESPFPNANSEAFKSEDVKAASAGDSSDKKENTDTKDSSQEANSTNSSNAPGGKNNMMFEMLKTMVPAEQKGTIENLSMLLNAMSYDNNSKSDDSKEHNNG